ncbi:MAG: SDR family NAD(P)-dependent oxidoreductase [Wenzhouxiangellaceae bacterium]|nr:SDR family NAD(P)-dependent oxidoreductase [Wenzhouxiangellaceae bacterium]MBS3824447.1 SDR family NAD(P)-dependent oxidoreductase [Wenzhouxiangellaceae bacterium]
MIKALGSLLFYGRFLRSFSALGFQRRSREWPPFKPDFSGQRWLVTGATGGIGRAVALAANRRGATVLALARSERKLEALRKAADHPARMLPVSADLSSIARVRALTGEPEIQAAPIDVLVNNVGVLLNDFETTDEGLEASFATNLLGPFTLTESLKTQDLLDADGIVINVSSGGMYGTPLKLEEMDCRGEDDYDGMAAYAMHKRAQVELTRYWNEHWQGEPAVHVMHPGWVDTEGVKTALPGFRTALRGILRDAEQGADTILWLAETRPAPTEEGIWLDRELRPEHEFAFTRKSRHDAEDLAGFLHERRESVRA